MKENDVVCKAGKNVEGFVTINEDGFLIKWMGGTDVTGKITYDDKTIPLEKFKGAILENCSIGGSYSIVSKSADGTISSKSVSVNKGHTFSNILVSPRSADETFLLVDKTKEDLDPDHKYVADYDENKDVIKAYSNDCTKQAKYQLYHYCFSTDCEKNKANNGETVGTQKITDKGTVHDFLEWKIDNSKTVYTKIDEKQHKEHYIETSKCAKCGTVGERDSVTPDAIKDHTLAAAEIEGSRVEATCGEAGSYKRGYTCACGYIKEDSITTVTVPATDKHDFGTNEAFIEWSGEVYVKGENLTTIARNIAARVVRKCNICGKTDGNGINGDKEGAAICNGTVISDPDMWGIVPGSIVDAKKDPTTGVTYTCSTAHATVFVDWLGTVDGKVVKLSDKKENVPYYVDKADYQGRTAHTPGAVKIENRVEPTADKDGSYDEVVYCTICGDEVSRNTVTVPKDIEVTIPTVTATAVNYNTVNVSWTPVEGATSYRLYYRSADLGITTWHRVRTLKGTSFTHSGLTTGARYRYTVRAEVDGKLGDYSRTGSVARPLPAAPEMKSVTAVSNGTKVTWSKVDGADGYIIFRKTTGAFTRVGSVSKGSKVTWTDKKPVSGATYKVRAYRTVNNVNYKGAFSAAK